MNKESAVDHKPSRQSQHSVVSIVQNFDDFFGASKGDVYKALLVALGDAHLAEDATAEAMARAFQHWKKISGYDSPAGWAYRVGLNWATSILRRRKYESASAIPDVPVSGSDPYDGSLVTALRRLKPIHREVLVMRYFLDLDQRTIAQSTGVPTGTVKSRIGRALEALRKELPNDR